MKVLIAEDERISRAMLQRQLERMELEVVCAEDGQEAWELFQAEPFSIVVCDWEMPRLNGVELVQRIRESPHHGYVYIVMLTGKTDTKDVVAGIDAGADDFVTKPFDRGELRARISAGIRIVELEQSLAQANGRLKHELAVARELSSAEHQKHEEALRGNSLAVRVLRSAIDNHAQSDSPVLLVGPPGAGQEAVARAIHRQSHRGQRPFIYVACAHLSSADSIFGVHDDEGSGHPAKAVLADGGTLFLDGINSLDSETRAELVSFLDDSAAKRAAGSVPNPDVRVIVDASEADAEDEPAPTASRLDRNRLTVPSLAERREDIAFIAECIIDRRATSAGRTLDGLTAESKEMLERYSWPGNLGELQSVIERAVVLAQGTHVDIPGELLQEGRRVGGYTLQRQLGQGAMGEVWLARHSLLARPAAVKLIRNEAFRADEEARERLEERFRREAEATARLRSPHTVELYDFGVTDDGDFFYVMEYLHGVDLDSLVRRFGAVVPARVVHLMVQACMSLGEAHEIELVHRDIKPANLFVCQLGPHDDFVKLLDFGIVRRTSDADQSATGRLAGTPSSLSPEVVQGESATPQSDIYGLGCVAYWLLTGQLVFDAPNVMALLLKHVSEQPTPMSDVTSGIPAQLEALVMQCLSKDPSERPDNAFELAEQLRSLPLEATWSPEQSKSWWQENAAAIFGRRPSSQRDPAMTETIDMDKIDTQ